VAQVVDRRLARPAAATTGWLANECLARYDSVRVPGEEGNHGWATANHDQPSEGSQCGA
jgi:hypothetical protein